MEKYIPLGTLTLGKKIGEGGFGKVHLGKLAPFEHDFAVKLLDPHPFQSPLARAHERFVREARILMSLRHPSIIPIYGIGEHESQPYILMEYFDGFDLNRARQKFGPPEPAKVLPFIEAAAQALQYAHAVGIVHRDLKPTNLMSKQGGHARVLDFGIAAIMDPESARFTRAGGTPVGDTFAAPEVIDDPRLVDPRSDIFSLAASWFWLLTGTTPRGRNWEASLRSVEGMTRSYESVLLKALDQVDKRYQTMAELARDVASLQSNQKPSATIAEELDHSVALVIGVVFEQYAPESEPTTVFKLEQQLAGGLTRFQLGMALRLLRKLEMIEDIEVEDDIRRELWTGIRPTEAGESWVERNRTNVESLLRDLESKRAESRQSAKDDIPF